MLTVFTRRLARFGRRSTLLAAAAASGLLAPSAWAQKQVSLLNFGYDPTRELCADFNKAFAAQWLKKTGEVLTMLIYRRLRGRRSGKAKRQACSSILPV